MNTISAVPVPRNEPVLSYAPNSPERAAIRQAIEEIKGEQRVLTSIINNEPVTSGKTVPFSAPHNHQEVVATVDQVGGDEVQLAIDANTHHASTRHRCIYA